jgi:hypothetical protein
LESTNKKSWQKKKLFANRKLVYGHLLSLPENIGKTLISDRAQNGKRTAVYKCKNSTCKYFKKYHLNVRMYDDSEAGKASDSLSVWVLGAENNVHKQEDGMECVGSGARRIKTEELMTAGGIVERIARHQLYHQSVGKKNNIVLTKSLLLQESVVASKDQIKKAQKKLKEKFREDEYAPLDNLEPYLTSFKKLNDGADFAIEKTDMRVLNRMCVLMPFAESVFQSFAFKVVALDGAHMKAISPPKNSLQTKKKRKIHIEDDATTAVTDDENNNGDEGATAVVMMLPMTAVVS